MHKKSFPLPKAYRLLGTGPTVLITTAEKGRANVMTLAWQMPMDFEPPLVGLILQVAPAHQRHGGAGAFYVCLRRRR